MPNTREKLIELFYDNNVRCDQKIEGLAEDVMDIVANGVTVFKHKDAFVEVVRCKDCKRWKYDAKKMAGLCKRHINYTAQWDFCSYGERKKING